MAALRHAGKWHSVTCVATMVLITCCHSAQAHDFIGVDDPDCACVGVELNCENITGLYQAMGTLEERECNGTHMMPDGMQMQNCQMDEECQNSFFAVVAHHYGCPRGSFPPNVSEAVHYYMKPAEGSPIAENFTYICNSCFQPRPHRQLLQSCPEYECHGGEADTAAAWEILQRDCTTNCSSPECQEAYNFASVQQEACVGNDIPMELQVGVAQFNELCNLEECNFPNATYSTEGYSVDCDSEKNTNPWGYRNEDHEGGHMNHGGDNSTEENGATVTSFHNLAVPAFLMTLVLLPLM